ncbi:malectin domain-containing carbohydrate-binding protein, partial [Maribacter antarcticus]|uniref:malectin domain-containing carbohydrate-binding protein n=1 Tax=Maribacter antarcticus TaxID=505250 RepID=UPI00146FC3C8
MIISVFMGFTGSVLAQGVDLVSSPTSVAVTQGDTFKVTIEIPQSNSQAFNAAALNLNFDSSVLQVVSVVAASGNQFNLPIGPSSDNTTGTVNYGGTVIGTSFTVGFPILDVTFEVIGAISTNIDFNVNVGGSRNTNIALNGTPVFGTAVSIPVTIASANDDPIADFTINPSPASTNEVVTFDGSFSTDDGTVDSYAWDFGDGNTQVASANSITTHSYTAIDTYIVALSVTDNLGAINTTTKTIMVSAPSVTQYNINASSNGNGTIAPSGAVSVNAGSGQTFSFSPNAGFEVSEVLVDGVPQYPLPTTSFTIQNVSAPANISVSFSATPTGPFQLCISSGSGDLIAFGRNFVGDPATVPPTGLGFTRTNGNVYAGYTGAVAGVSTDDELTLFQKEIYGGKTGTNPAYNYNIPVANGLYQVDLYFAEVFHSITNKRIFDVLLEGNVILDEYEMVDPIKDGISTFKTAITRTYYVSVTDGSLQVGIGPAAIDNGKLSGLCITAVTSANLHPVSTIGNLTYDASVAVADPLNIVDPENDVLSVVFNGLPASLSYDPSTNQIQGTPLATDVNTYTINAIISDGNSDPVTEEFILVINPVLGNDSPTIDAIVDLQVNEGELISQAIMVTDDNLPAATIEIFDVSEGGTNNPFTPTSAVVVGTLVDNTGGSYTFNWSPVAGTGRSYLARVTADDGVNPVVIEEFRIDVAQQLPGLILARTFNNPVPWYGSSAPGNGFSVAIETSAAKNIGYINNEDFVEYLINVPAAGTFDVEIFAGKGNEGATIVTLSEEDGGGGFSAIGSVNVLKSGWQTFVSYETQVTFTNAGVQTLRFDFNGGANIRDFNFTSPNDTSPTIDAIADLQVNEGELITQAILVTDDNLPTATIEIFDVSEGGTNNPFTPTTAVAVGTLVDNTGGSYIFNWTPAAGTGRSYLAKVTADDGVNSIVIEEFRIDVAQQLPGLILARTFNNPVPWYGVKPKAGFTVAIENAGNIGWTGVGEFVEYLINVPTVGDYNMRLNSSNGSNSATNITILEEGNATPIGIVNVPNAGWGNPLDFTTTVTFTDTGLQTLRLAFDGGVNTNEFEFTSSTGNTAPDVTITSPEDNMVAESDFSINFTGTATDTQDGNLSTSIVWSSNLDGALGAGANINATLTEGTHVITAEATDLDGTPLIGSTTVSLIIVSQSPFCDTRFRVNAGGPMVNSATGDFKEDQALSAAGGIAQTGTPSIYVNTVLPAVDKTFAAIGTLTNTTGYPDYLFQTERFSDAANPNNMNWSFPTGDGIYDVKILFNENWSNENANANTHRIFDVKIEGDIALDDYRPSVDGTEINVAKVEVFRATVTDGVLNINFIKGNENPSVKGFDICFVSDLPTDTPPVVTISSPTDNITPVSIDRLVSTTFTATAEDAEDDNTTLTNALVWSINPIEANFAGTGGTFDDTLLVPGVYTIRATSTDSDTNAAFDEIEVIVLGPDVNFTSPAENADLVTKNIQVTWSATNMNFGGTTPEHFHLWVNPADENNLVSSDRISTASFAGQLFWDLTAIDGIVEGANKVVIIAADSGHLEFLNSEARDEVNFNVLGDTTNPIAVCQNIIVELDETGNVAITAADVDGGSSDDEGIASLTIDVDSFFGANLGPNTVTLMVTDTNNNTTTCTAIVTVEDNLAPTAICQDITVELDANGNVAITAADVDGGSTDNGGIDTISIDTSDFNAKNVGANTVTLTITDTSGNHSTCTATVTVEDNEAPTAICQNFTVALDANGQATITATDMDNGSNDAAGIASLSVNLSSFDCADVGDNTVMLIVEDNNGNTASCMATVTVIDETPPVLVDCPGNRFITSPTAQVLELNPPTASDACGVNTITIVGSRSDGLELTDSYLVGTVTMVTWIATDNNGAVGTCQTQVTITAPISSGKQITGFDVTEQVGNEIIDSGTGTIALTVSTGTSLAALAPTIVISNAAEISPSSGTPRDFTTPQTYTVTAQNDTTKEWTVTISVAPDMEDPVITSCPDDMIVANDTGVCGALVTFNAIATDNLPGVTLSYSVASESVFDVGTTTVTVTATDAIGLTASCSFDVTVNDTQAPTLSCLIDTTVQGDIAGNAILPDFTGMAVASDNCNQSIVVTQSPAPGTMVSGTVLVTFTAIAAGLTSAPCTFNAIIKPAILASLTIAPSAITVNLIQGETAMRDYVVASDDASTLPTPAAMSIIDNATNNPATWASTTSAANQGTSYEVNLDATGLTPGTYTAILTAGPVSGYTNAGIPVTLIVAPEVGNTALIVLDATTDTPLFDLTDGLQINKATIGNMPLGIIFNSSFNPGAVQFT